MIVGHFGPALIAHQKLPRTSVGLFLVASQLPDAVWIALGLAGLETPQPRSFLDASFANLVVDMPYSHDLVPLLLLTLAVAVVAALFLRSIATALWIAALMVVHELCDLVSGFGHYIFGHATPRIGLNLYGRAPELAVILEAVFGAACVAWFVSARKAEGRALSLSSVRWLYGIFVVGALVWLPMARTPLSALLGHVVAFK